MACARHITEALVDPDQILGLPLDPARRQIGGQHSQLTAGTGRKRRLNAIVQLTRSEQAFAGGSGQRLDDPIPVRMRHPQFELRILLRRAVSGRVTVCHDLILVTTAAPRNAVSGRVTREVTMSKPWPGIPNGKPSPVLMCWRSPERSGAPQPSERSSANTPGEEDLVNAEEWR